MIKLWILGSVFISAGLLLSQPAEEPLKFEAADVHASAKATGRLGQFVRTGPVRAGRYEIKNATMVDLIHIAYDYDADKVLGGPS